MVFYHSPGKTAFYPASEIGREDGQSLVEITKYCPYCKKMTPHHVVNPHINKEGTGQDLRCTECNSARLGQIQGFDAALM